VTNAVAYSNAGVVVVNSKVVRLTPRNGYWHCSKWTVAPSISAWQKNSGINASSRSSPISLKLIKNYISYFFLHSKKSYQL
jgi:hypothetical protein